MWFDWYATKAPLRKQKGSSRGEGHLLIPWICAEKWALMAATIFSMCCPRTGIPEWNCTFVNTEPIKYSNHTC
ncbi:hypothetical protein BDV11DRAFT_199067 [Aspergillus similis]